MIGRLLIAFMCLLGMCMCPAASAGVSDQLVSLEADAQETCAGAPQSQGFADRLDAMLGSGAASQDELAALAPDALLRLAEIRRINGRFARAAELYHRVAALDGTPGEIAREELESIDWDRKLRAAPKSSGKEIVAAVREVGAKGQPRLLLALWRAPVQEQACVAGLFEPINFGAAHLTLYRPGTDGKALIYVKSFKIDVGAVDIAAPVVATDGTIGVSVRLLDGGNCFNCESQVANFLVDGGSLRELKPPGIGQFHDPLWLEGGIIHATTMDSRWETFGSYAHVNGSAALSRWRLEGQHFVEDCAQSTEFECHESSQTDDPGTAFQDATQRFIDTVQSGRIDAAWERYQHDLTAISARWPEHKAHLDQLTKFLDADIASSRGEMLRHECHLEGLKLTRDY